MKDNSILATAIPTITTAFNSLDDVGWYGSAFLICVSVSHLVTRYFIHCLTIPTCMLTLFCQQLCSTTHFRENIPILLSQVDISIFSRTLRIGKFDMCNSCLFGHAHCWACRCRHGGSRTFLRCSSHPCTFDTVASAAE